MWWCYTTRQGAHPPSMHLSPLSLIISLIVWSRPCLRLKVSVCIYSIFTVLSLRLSVNGITLWYLSSFPYTILDSRWCCWVYFEASASPVHCFSINLKASQWVMDLKTQPRDLVIMVTILKFVYTETVCRQRTFSLGTGLLIVSIAGIQPIIVK